MRQDCYPEPVVPEKPVAPVGIIKPTTRLPSEPVAGVFPMWAIYVATGVVIIIVAVVVISLLKIKTKKKTKLVQVKSAIDDSLDKSIDDQIR